MAYLVALVILFFVLTATPARTFVVQRFMALRSNDAANATIAKGEKYLTDVRTSVTEKVQAWIRQRAHQELDKTLDQEFK